ncbi:ferredoxin--NADP reductase [Nonlabens ponticola]|uniref:Ferredoxin--NADP reductase n=1 Tax=Nonlabens ponticola TaxID=2496866 RepID=A0A3S9MVP6_9FLAO|nr:ferredoxin--NADP reductase [Nonlabens ponticola]AZQ43212.1 ferredoxin--NADP reductase [Nonlabens ponticola]
MVFHQLSIKEVTKVTSQAVEIVFDVPQDLKSDFEYTAGQYLTLRADIDGNDVRRAYSLSSAPHEDHLSVVVKAVQHGTFSNYAMKLRAGDTLQVAPPDGLFIHESDASAVNHYLNVAAGSGITPIMSIIKSILHTEKDSRVVLIYGNQSQSQTIYFEQLNDLQDAHPDRFKVRYSFSREERQDELFGRVNKANLNYFLKNDCEDYAFAKAYLCGPEAMINMATNNLTEKEVVAKENIKFELFTATESEVEITEDSHLTEVKVILDDEEHQLTMRRDETLLEVMLKNDIDAPYSCQGGICSSCVGLLEEGKATMRKNSILTDEEVDEGLTLTCQACPTTAKIVVNFDEV